MTITYGSVCSGIEAATVAWHSLGWKPSFFSEIEAFPRAVLSHHYPDVPLHGDFTTIQKGQYAAIDLLVGGTPCQSFSVAGLRGGLDDERGNLALEYLRLADRLGPRWLVWENVPGVLSSNGGRDFGAILGGMVELGYGFAYRVLDAQHFGVPQRRRRVFVVGYLGDWRPAAAVLFERHSMQGYPAPRREAGKGSTPVTARSVALRGRDGGSTAELGDDVGLTLRASSGGGDKPHVLAFGGGNTKGVRHDFEIETFVAQPMAFSCKDHGADAGDIAPTLRAMGHDGSHANAGGQIAVAFDTTQITSATNRCNPQPGDPCHPLAAGAHAPAIAFIQGERDGRMDGGTPQSQDDMPTGAVRGVRSCECGGAPQERGLEGSQAGEPAAPLQELPHEGAQVGHEMHALRQPAQRAGVLRDALQAFQEVGRPDCGQGQPVHATAQGLRTEPTDGMQGFGLHGQVPRTGLLQQTRPAGTQGDAGTAANDKVRGIPDSMAIRRLTARECERLQGFQWLCTPDYPGAWQDEAGRWWSPDYTAIPWRKKPASECPDGPRYKALGNSMAVPVMHWIGQRIEVVSHALSGAVS